MGEVWAGVNSFPCPACGGKMSVIDSRPSRSLKAIRRRRKCDACGEKLTTMEMVYAPGVGPDNNRKQVVMKALNALHEAVKAYIPSGEWDEIE